MKSNNIIHRNIAGLFAFAAGVGILLGTASACLANTDAAPTLPQTLTAASASDSTATPNTAPTTAPEKPKSRHTPWIGPELGGYFPTNSKVRDRFGSSWLGVYLGLGPIAQPNDHHTWTIDYSVLYNKVDSNYALIAPIGLSYRRFFTHNKSFNPYVGTSGDLVISDVRSDPDNVKAGVRTGLGGSVFGGVSMGERAFFEARYNLMGTVKGFDFSGTSLTLGYRF